MADVIRVLRLIEYIGPREAVEKQVEKSIHGIRAVRNGQDQWIRIRATTLGEAAEILTWEEAEDARKDVAGSPLPGE